MYDLSKLIHRHPGGILPIQHMRGIDATEQMNAFHPIGLLKKRLPGYYIGYLIPEQEKEQEGIDNNDKKSQTELSKKFKLLTKELEENGYFQTEYKYYFYIFLRILFIGLSFVVPLILGMGNSWLRVTVLGLLQGLFWQQIAFVAHDAGHNSITHHRATDKLIGVVVTNVLSGLSIGWWKHSHNVHHLVTNSIYHDQDIQDLPVLAVTPDFFNDVYSTFHKRVLKFNWVSKLLIPIQHWNYVPLLMVFGRPNLYLKSILYLLNPEEIVEWRNLEIFGMIMFFKWYSLLVSFIPSTDLCFLYLCISHFFMGILHVQITASHYSMSTKEKTDDEEWCKHQLRTTMDIITDMDWFHGGLQFQVVHHLFPRVPRHKLKEVKIKVQKLCDEFGLEYVGKNFWNANESTFKRLKEVAELVQFCASQDIN